MPIFVALLWLGSLGLAGLIAGLRPDPPSNVQDHPSRSDSAAESRPVEGVLRAPESRNPGGRKTWM